ncbi:uncharacterized [Tachysurus ichikawai]
MVVALVSVALNVVMEVAESDQLEEEPPTGNKESAQEPEQETVGPVEELIVETGEEKGLEVVTKAVQELSTGWTHGLYGLPYKFYKEL